MEEKKTVTPLEVGLLIVVVTYFLFTLHAVFTTQWWGEWNISGHFNFGVFITDIACLPGLIARLFGSLIALVAISIVFTKKGLSQSTATKLLKAVLVLEAIYWLSLLPSGIWGTLPLTPGGFSFSFFMNTGLPCLVGSIGIPICLFALVKNLGINKPEKRAIIWAMLSGVFYVLTFWLNNSGMWITIVLERGKGFSYVLGAPQYVLSFAATLFGMLALAICTVYFAVKMRGTEHVKDLRVGAVGGILTALGIYYLWNYLTWIFFGGWNDWYAWILGHNLDLWLLSLPLVGLPLLFYTKPKTQTPEP